MDILNAPDFVAFGLILHISNINEIEHFNDSERSWKTIQNGLSIVFILFYGVLFACSLLGQSNPGLINVGAITNISSATVYSDQNLAKLRQVLLLKFDRCQIP